MSNDTSPDASSIRRRDVLKIAGTTGAGITLAGCSQNGGGNGDGTPTPTSSSGNGGGNGGGGTQTLTIGQAIPLTGPGSVYGQPTSGGVTMAVEDVNSDGGIEVDGTTYELEYLTADSKCAPEAGRNAAQSLISNENVDLMFGGNCPTANLAWIDLVKDNDMFIVVNGNESIELHSMGYDYDYIFSPFTVINNETFPNLSRMYPFGTYAVKELGFENVAFLTPEIQYGLSTQDAIGNAVENAGGTVAGKVTHSFGASDFSNQIAKLKSLDADVVVASTFPNAFFAFLKQATDAGLREQMQIVSAQSPAEEIANRLVSDDVADGFLDFALTYEPAQQAAAAGDIASQPANRQKEFRSRFQDRYSERTFNALAVSGYESVMLLKTAIEKAGGVDNDSLASGFGSISWSDVQDFTMQYYVPPNGSVSGTERQGKIFGGGHQAFYESSLQKWNKGNKEYQELIRVGPYWNQ